MYRKPDVLIAFLLIIIITLFSWLTSVRLSNLLAGAIIGLTLFCAIRTWKELSN